MLFMTVITLLIFHRKGAKMLALIEKARSHWTKHLPELVAELKSQGILESELKRAASQATKALTAHLRNGMKIHQAREMVLREYILIDPETTE